MMTLNLETIRVEVPADVLIGFHSIPQVAGQARLLGRSLAKAGKAQVGKIQAGLVQAPQTQIGR